MLVQIWVKGAINEQVSTTMLSVNGLTTIDSEPMTEIAEPEPISSRTRARAMEIVEGNMEPPVPSEAIGQENTSLRESVKSTPVSPNDASRTVSHDGKLPEGSGDGEAPSEPLSESPIPYTLRSAQKGTIQKAGWNPNYQSTKTSPQKPADYTPVLPPRLWEQTIPEVPPRVDPPTTGQCRKCTRTRFCKEHTRVQKKERTPQTHPPHSRRS